MVLNVSMLVEIGDEREVWLAIQIGWISAPRVLWLSNRAPKETNITFLLYIQRPYFIY